MIRRFAVPGTRSASSRGLSAARLAKRISSTGLILVIAGMAMTLAGPVRGLAEEHVIGPETGPAQSLLGLLAIGLAALASSVAHPLANRNEVSGALRIAVLLLLPFTIAQPAHSPGVDAGSGVAIIIGLMMIGQLCARRAPDLGVLLTLCAALPLLIALDGTLMGARNFHGEIAPANIVALAGLWLMSIARFQRQTHVRHVLSPTPIGALIRMQVILWLVLTFGIAALHGPGGSSDGTFAPALLTAQLIGGMALVTYFSLRTLEMFHQHKMSERRLREQASRDGLTGLTRRQAARDRLNLIPNDVALGVMMIDVDHFKSFNDRHGHAAGDSVLVQIGDALRRNLRIADVAARWGGEEFLVAIEDVSLNELTCVAEKLRQSIAALPPVAEGAAPITISVGVAHRRGGADESLDDLIARADAALYAAKARGRNLVDCANCIVADICLGDIETVRVAQAVLDRQPVAQRAG